MKRICILVPALELTRAIVQELEAAGLKEDDIHVLGNSEDLKKAHLPEANVAHISDFFPALKRGVKLGVLLAIATFVMFTLVVPANLTIPAWVIAIMLFFGVVFGAWASTLIGVGIVDPVVEKYEKYLKDGQYLMLVDAADEKEQELTNRILSQHQEVKLITKTIH